VVKYILVSRRKEGRKGGREGGKEETLIFSFFLVLELWVKDCEPIFYRDHSRNKSGVKFKIFNNSIGGGTSQVQGETKSQH
jgi:hypothetical protein